MPTPPDAPAPLLPAPKPVRPPPARRSSSGHRLMFPIDMQQAPVPPSVANRTLAPPAPSVPLLAYALDSYRLGGSSDRVSPNRGMRPPSPLPPPLREPLPSEIESMSLRLTALVQQSNAYVAGLKARLDGVDEARASFAQPISREQLVVFLEAQPDFLGLDVERLLTFQLPLQVWRRVADQVLKDHPERGESLCSILYWRARAEAEALGVLQPDHRSSTSSSQFFGFFDSRRPSVASVASLYATDSQDSSEGGSSRRPSAPLAPVPGPRRRSGNEVASQTIAE